MTVSFEITDGHCVYLDSESPETLVEHITYWQSMRSHAGSMVWKGYLQINLGPAKDA